MQILGKLCVKSWVKKQPMHVVFDIVHKNQATISVVLSQHWIGGHNLQINWVTRMKAFQVDLINLIEKIFELEEQLGCQHISPSMPSTPQQPPIH